VKSSFCGNSNSCADVTRTKRGYIRIRNTNVPDVVVEFNRAEWEALTKGIMIGELKYDAVPVEDADLTPAERKRITQARTHRTPENQAFVNGRFAERNGWIHMDFIAFCRKFHHVAGEDRSHRLYESFLTGRRAEALENS
jgi:hypothetical protein